MGVPISNYWGNDGRETSPWGNYGQETSLVLNIKVSLVDKQAPLACAGVTLPCEGHFKVPQLDSFFFTALSQLLHGIQEEPGLI